MQQSSARLALEWLDQNMHTSYPFAFSSSSPVTAKSGVVLPSSFIVDIQVLVDSDVASTEYAGSKAALRSGFFVSAVSASAAGFVVDVSYTFHGNDYLVARSSLIPRSVPYQEAEASADNMLEGRIFQLSPIGTTGNQGLDDIRGSISIGTCSDMMSIGTLTFSREATPILPSRVALVPFGLRSVTVGDETITGNFTLKAGDGVELSVDSSGARPVVLVNSTVSGLSDEYGSLDMLVQAVLAELGDPVLSINGVGPDEAGNVELLGGDCTDIEVSGANTVTINNACAKPCCGDVNREQMELALSSLETAQARLLAYYQALTNNVNAVQARLSSLLATQ